ncbi:MAG: hypothetical protein HOV92_38665, partial [Streptomyces sp.]|nr:hypothetical protein [Streptomyces sp.]
MKSAPRTRGLPRLAAALALAALTVLWVAPAPPAAAAGPAATSVSTIAEALRDSPVYVDPAASDQLSTADATTLADQIENADKPLFVAVLPAGYPTQNLFTKLRTATGVTGLYAIRLGDAFDARADSTVLPRSAVQNLVTTVAGEDARSQLSDFTNSALTNMGGSAPASWNSSSDGGGVPTGALITLGAVLVAGGAGGYALVRRNR